MADEDNNEILNHPAVKKALAKIENNLNRLEEIIAESERKASPSPIVECAYCHKRIRKKKAYHLENEDEYFCDEEHREMYWD